MSQKQTFTAVIEGSDGGGAYVTVPFDVEQVFGKKRVKIVATIEGEPYRGSLVRMGARHLLIVRKDIRARIGKDVGDAVTVTVEEDTAPREVAVPPDFQQALDAAPEAKAFFDGLSYTHRREYVAWIEEARREQTRKDRIERAVEMLRAGKKSR